MRLKETCDHLHKARHDQKASFDHQIAKAELDAGEIKAQFDNQLAKADLDAHAMKV